MNRTGLLLFFIGVLTAAASQVAVLNDGTRIPVTRHENIGPELIRLHTPQGIEDVLAAEIEKFEDIVPLEAPPPLPATVKIAWNGPVPGKAPNAPKRATKTVNPDELARAAARKHNVPEAIVKSIMAAESAFNPNARSPKGAIGLMQLMPATAKEMGYNPHIPQENVYAGARYLRQLLDKYQDSRDWLRRVIAAYNAGPGAVDRYRGVPPYRETRTYVSRVLSYLRYYQNESAKDPA